MISTSSNLARIVTDGFHLFAHRETYLTSFMLPEVKLIRDHPLTPETLEIFRCHRLEGNKLRHDKSNIRYDITLVQNLKFLILNNLYLTPEFGISVAVDPDLALLELSVRPAPTVFSQTFQFKTIDGFSFEPDCYFNIL